jgi:chromosome segregation ATPase
MNERLLKIKEKIQKLLDENDHFKKSNENLKAEIREVQSKMLGLKEQFESIQSNNVIDEEEVQLLKSALDRKTIMLEETDDQIRQLKIRISELEEENLLKENTLEIQKNTINDLKEQNKLIKLANEMSEESPNNHDLKIKINELIRDIDRCIDLLNE